MSGGTLGYRHTKPRRRSAGAAAGWLCVGADGAGLSGDAGGAGTAGAWAPVGRVGLRVVARYWLSTVIRFVRYSHVQIPFAGGRERTGRRVCAVMAVMACEDGRRWAARMCEDLTMTSSRKGRGA